MTTTVDTAQIQPIGPHPSVDTLLIGALLWAPVQTAVSVLGLVDDDDLEHPAAATVLAAIRALALAGTPTGPQLVFDELKRTGEATALVLDHLRAAVTSGAEPLAADASAAAVVASRFRRFVANIGNAQVCLAARGSRRANHRHDARFVKAMAPAWRVPVGSRDQAGCHPLREHHNENTHLVRTPRAA
ncbi:hypothetical protein [Mycobacterium sp.]|uniref:hypothetical protein n=1 Tax=Mycobacterium sp. TaxID=1785 RepID=UPI003F9B901C